MSDEDTGASVLPFPKQPIAAVPETSPAALRDALGDVLREERRRQDRTLADVADEAAVSLAYLSEIERAHKDVSSELLGAVCDALETPLATILERCADRLRAGTQGGRGIQLRAA